jgi:hypothetical protein
MTHSRRDLGGLALSLLAATKAAAQRQSPILKSAKYRIEDRAAPIPGSFAHPIFNGERKRLVKRSGEGVLCRA